MNGMGQSISMSPDELLARYRAGEREFSGMSLIEANLSGANLKGVNLEGAVLKMVNLSGANLSGANLSGAKLNLTKLGKANLSYTNLQGTNLSVTNLTLADLQHANLQRATLIKAELQRANLSQANLQGVNLTNADLQDTKFCRTNLQGANLSRTDLRRSSMIAANLEQANLHNSDLSFADLTGANLHRAELRQANLSRVNFQGVNLQEANLRWADLSGADLRWSDLSGAVLSGATLTGADLSGATLLGTTLVHVDLTRANLSNIDWAGADFSGAQMTGAKLYGTKLHGAKLGEITCRWLDLSLNGDRSTVYHFQTEDAYEFFYRSAPRVQVTLDDCLDPDSHSLLAATYRKLSRVTPIPAPNITVSRHRTILSFELKDDRDLFLMAAAGIFPFQDAALTQESLQRILNATVPDSESQESSGTPSSLKLLQDLMPILHQLRSNLDHPFFQIPTDTQVVNSEGHRLTLYRNPLFSKRSVPFFQQEDDFKTNSLPAFIQPATEQILQFITAFRQGTPPQV